MESIQNSYYYYLIDLSDALAKLLRRLDTEDIKALFNEAFNRLGERLNTELDQTLDSLKKMLFNELKYTKLACHIMFLQKLSSFATDKNKTELNSVVDKIQANHEYFNSFLQFYL